MVLKHVLRSIELDLTFIIVCLGPLDDINKNVS